MRGRRPAHRTRAPDSGGAGDYLRAAARRLVDNRTFGPYSPIGLAVRLIREKCMTTAVDVFSKLAQVGVGTNDIGAMLDLCADDVVFEFPFAPPGRPARVEGKPALRDYLKAVAGRVRIE